MKNNHLLNYNMKSNLDSNANDDIHKKINEIIIENKKIKKKIRIMETKNSEMQNKNELLEKEVDNLYKEIDDINNDYEYDEEDIDDNKFTKLQIEKYIKKKLLNKFKLTDYDMKKNDNKRKYNDNNENNYMKLRSNKIIKKNNNTQSNNNDLINDIINEANNILNNDDNNDDDNTNDDNDEKEYKECLNKQECIIYYYKHYNLSMDYCIIVNYEKINIDNLNYFLEQDMIRKKELIEIEKKIKKYNKIYEIPKRYKVMDVDIDDKTKGHLYENVKFLEMMDKNDSDYSKMDKWLDGACKLPFNKFTKPKVPSLLSEPSIIKQYLTESKMNMDKIIYGQDESKNRIIEILGKIIRSGSSGGNIFSVYGPPGVGKTSLIKEGLSKVLGIPFQLISLGGLFDSSYLKGHEYTYVGSVPGIIASALIKHQCMNPIFYFDELDKVSKSDKGQDIINTIIHLADKTQNDEYYDNYFDGVKLDLSKCIFVFSYNDKNNISPTLLDRMETIKMDGYTNDEKINIIMNYTIPKYYKEFNISDNQIIIPEKTIKYIINNYCSNELECNYEYLDMNYKKTGIRKLNKYIEALFNKLNIILLTGSWNNIKIDKLPINVDNNLINKLLIKNKNITDNSHLHTMYS